MELKVKIKKRKPDNKTSKVQKSKYKIIKGHCIQVMKTMPENYVDSIITDPPYGLKFMNKNWDHGVPGIPFWKEALRVAKPGAHLLAFGGTRTYHRLVCAIEDAGWEIRDMLMWVYGSGFPKSLDIGKAVDKLQGNEREIVGKTSVCGTFKQEYQVKQGYRPESNFSGYAGERNGAFRTKGTSEWEGFGTALKPSWEPIILARKPLIGTVAENILKHGTGGINIDGCRIEAEKTTGWGGNPSNGFSGGLNQPNGKERPVQGRFPANLIHDNSPEVVGCFPETTSGGANGNRKKGPYSNNRTWSVSETPGAEVKNGLCSSTGSASRFFQACPYDTEDIKDYQRIAYFAKASKRDRNKGCETLEAVIHQSGMGGAMPVDDNGKDRDRFKTVSRNHHPTVKPTSLMQYLCKLITPPKGKILDIFAGSGSTGKAAILEGFKVILIEKEQDYIPIIKARVKDAEKKSKLPKQIALF
jgi:DNA modification methylase